MVMHAGITKTNGTRNAFDKKKVGVVSSCRSRQRVLDTSVIDDRREVAWRSHRLVGRDGGYEYK